MNFRKAQGVRSRTESFGCVVYVPARDDFFILDSTAARLVNTSKVNWQAVPVSLRHVAKLLGELQILDLKPRVQVRQYSGVHIVGDIPDLPTITQPLLVNCFATFRCPLSCKYCHAWDLMKEKVVAEDRGQVASEIQIANVVSKLGCMVAVITGGEPLDRPERSATLIEALSSRVALVLDTSGGVSEDKLGAIVPVLKRHKVHVRVSLDSADQRTHNLLRPLTSRAKVTGEDSHQRAIRAIERFRDEGLNVTVQTVLSSRNDNGDSLMDLRDLLVNVLRVENWVIHCAVNAGKARSVEERLGSRRRGSILPVARWRTIVEKLVRNANSFPLDIRITDESSTPNSVLLLGADGRLYTEGRSGKLDLTTSTDKHHPFPKHLVDFRGHALRYLNWWHNDGKLETLKY